MRRNRGAFLRCVAAFSSIAMVRRRAEAAEFELRLAFDQPSNHPMTIRATEAAEKIKGESGNRVDLQIFPSNQLGGDSSMLAQVRSGAVSMVLMSDGILSNVVPVAAIENVAFAFSGYRQAFEAMDGALGTFIRSSIFKAGLYPFEKIWCSGFKQVVNSVRPLSVPGDFRGLKFRVPPSPMETALFKAVNASAVPINFSEAYVALQTHLVDGASLPIVTVETSKFFEVQKFLTMTNHIFTGYSLLANGDAWQKLPKNLRDLVERHLNAAAVLERADIVALEEQTSTKLQSQGMQIVRPDVAQFRAAMQSAGFYRGWKEQFGAEAWGLLEKSAGTLT